MPNFDHWITKKKRTADWQTMYPKAKYWNLWHTNLIGHNPNGFVIVVTVQDLETLWNTHTIHTKASGNLERFERYTVFGYFDVRTTLSLQFLQQVSDHIISNGTTLWYDLEDHYQKHGHITSSELPILNAAARALAAFAQNHSMPQNLLDRFFFNRVDDQNSYAQLALSAWIAARLDYHAFIFALYSPNAPAKHSININLHISSDFIRTWAGIESYGVTVGLGVASAYPIHYANPVIYVPHLLSNIVISTVFAPSGQRLPPKGYASEIVFS
jgi:hypothetical protein